VSLVRSAKITVTTAFPAAFRSGPASVEFSDLGSHRIRLGLGRLTAGAAREGYPAALAETLFATPLATESGPAGAGEVFPILEGMPSLIPCWAAPLGRDRWILRLHETMGRRGEVLVKPRPGWTARLLAKAFPGPGDKPWPSGSGGRLAVGPFAILGIELSRGRMR
jgi:alpha-mannosidase